MVEEESMPRRCAVVKTVPKRCVTEEETAPKRSVERRSVTYPSSLEKSLKKHNVREEECEEEDEM